MNLIVALRLLNIVLAAANFVILVYAIRGWRRRSAGNRFHWTGVGLLLLAIAYGQIESLAQRNPGGIRTVLTAVALAYLLIGTISKARGEWTEDVSEKQRRYSDEQR